MPYVYSTLTCDQAYTSFDESPDAEIKRGKRIAIIKGGHGVANKQFVTARGVATEVTDAQLAALEKCDAFNRHVANGFIKTDRKEIKPEKVAADLQKKDDSAPKTPEDFKTAKVNKKGNPDSE